MKNQNIIIFVFGLFCLNIFLSCESEQGPGPVDCTITDLSITVSSVTDASGCTTADGSVTLAATGGSDPYQFKINDGALQASGTFSNLAPGNYSATVVDDNGCEKIIDFQILQGSSSLAFTSAPGATTSGCGTNNATITVEATGEGTVQFKLDDGSFTTSNVFNNVSAGNHTITITDDSGCTSTAEIKVLTGVSYETEIDPILMNNCAISGCHDGSNGSSLNWTVFENVQNKADRIKTLTGDGTMPPASSGKTLTQEQKNLIACWVDDGALNN